MALHLFLPYRDDWARGDELYNLKCDTMRTLTDTPLFNLFTAYLGGTKLAAGELPAAYDSFVTLLEELPQDESRMRQLRRVNYTRIELAFMQTASEKMAERRHVLYDVFIGKTLALLDAEIEIIKEMFRHGGGMEGQKPEIVDGACKKAGITLNWNGTDSDLIELVAALMAAGAVTVTRNFAASLFRNIKYFTLRKLYLCRKWMQKRLQKTTTTGITLPNFDFLA